MLLAANHLASTSRDVAIHVDDAYRLLGLMIATLFPAAFWVTAVAAAGALADAPVPTNALVGLGCAITAFLGLICGPVMFRD
ncbi:MAG: hypothetical protein ACKVP4_09180 [Hyphomicrobium sp.]